MYYYVLFNPELLYNFSCSKQKYFGVSSHVLFFSVSEATKRLQITFYLK